MEKINLWGETTGEKLIALEEAINKIVENQVVFVPCGEWSSDASYERYSLVTYQNKTYVSIYNGNQSGHIPTDTEFWALFIDPPKGDKGETGQNGVNGISPTVSVGTVSTLPAGSQATVQNSGTSQNVILNFGIPKGDKGEDAPSKYIHFIHLMSVDGQQYINFSLILDKSEPATNVNAVEILMNYYSNISNTPIPVFGIIKISQDQKIVTVAHSRDGYFTLSGYSLTNGNVTGIGNFLDLCQTFDTTDKVYPLGGS